MQEAERLADYIYGKEKLITDDSLAAAKAFDHFITRTKWQHWRSCYCAIFSSIAHRELGEGNQANEILKTAMQQIHEHTFPYPILQYLSGKRSFDDLLKDASENKSNRILCYAYAGLDNFARKNYDLAHQQFMWVKSNCDEKDSFEFRACNSRLQQLDKLKAGDLFNLGN